MATIRFDRQDELDALIARIYLDTRQKLSKKELLEIIFEVGIQDYQLLKQKIQEPKKNSDGGLRSQFIERISGVLPVSDADVDKINPKSIWKNVVE
nr:hypothetical protein [Candidatus Sigynarchaeum springense]